MVMVTMMTGDDDGDVHVNNDKGDDDRGAYDDV